MAHRTGSAGLTPGCGRTCIWATERRLYRGHEHLNGSPGCGPGRTLPDADITYLLGAAVLRQRAAVSDDGSKVRSYELVAAGPAGRIRAGRRDPAFRRSRRNRLSHPSGGRRLQHLRDPRRPGRPADLLRNRAVDHRPPHRLPDVVPDRWPRACSRVPGLASSDADHSRGCRPHVRRAIRGGDSRRASLVRRRPPRLGAGPRSDLVPRTACATPS